MTCYSEQIKSLPEDKRKAAVDRNSNAELEQFIKPHGICLGCMVHCHKGHEGHEVHELYHKLDFRCDCGNSRLPYSCSLNNEKDYENEKNVYNKTFFDSYCYCKKSHSYEEIDKFMI